MHGKYMAEKKKFLRTGTKSEFKNQFIILRTSFVEKIFNFEEHLSIQLGTDTSGFCKILVAEYLYGAIFLRSLIRSRFTRPARRYFEIAEPLSNLVREKGRRLVWLNRA